jgi:hypothetical protein
MRKNPQFGKLLEWLAQGAARAEERIWLPRTMMSSEFSGQGYFSQEME